MEATNGLLSSSIVNRGSGVINGTIDFSEPLSDVTGQIHHLPCTIKHSGPCTVSNYFKPTKPGVVVDGLEVEEAYFRGRKLQGTSISMPNGYSGFVLEKKKLNASESSSMRSHENTDMQWKASGKFHKMAYWNHDDLPSHDNAYFRLFHWFSIADALHSPVKPDEMLSSIEEQGL